MATADTQSAKPRSSRRRLHNPQVENDFAPGDGEPPARPPPLQRSRSLKERPTKQLDFYQAMSDFKVSGYQTLVGISFLCFINTLSVKGIS